MIYKINGNYFATCCDQIYKSIVTYRSVAYIKENVDKNYKKHFSYNEFVREMGFKNCHDIPSSCWLYIACNEVGWFQTLSDRYPSLRKFLGLKQFSKVRILFHELWMNENQK